MCALPARRIASSALCAALLVGITGPVAMAADSARGHAHVAPDTRLPGADRRLAQIEKLNWGELTPVADLLNAVLRSNGRLPAAEARKLGAEAKAALAEAAGKDARTPATSTVVLLPAPALPALPALVSGVPERRAADPVTDLLDLVLGAVDGLLQAITSGVGGILPSVDDLLNGVDDLLDALLGGDLLLQDEPASSTASTSSSTSPSTSSTSAPAAVTYPKATVLTPLLSPPS
ncbi:hypothetical protein STAFG_1408 [Streptomyces afghaniensis 772]|uniref:Uncharacterized protein n=1 Tax=Streptomyces afghaniensis 772 TaxID=1283301 RepID=S4MPP4_9ACTN|nr:MULTISPECIES: hypothetical protein [Streptomyces]EPJ41533.1 hypothetical protein STAFG_1408 [Streptomyces afghaniensis 772]UOB12804.1 hypothetical protein MQE23_28790 [Streptomyces sp. HP-A2021]